MTLLFKLIWRDLRANPGRVAVSVFAILVSVSLIVWMMGSYDTLVKEFDNDAEAYMGSYDLCLVPEAPKGPLPPGQYPRFSDPDLAARLAASPLVESVNAACQVPRLQIGCGNERGSFDEQTRDRMGIPPQSPILVGNHAVECPYDLKEGVWPDMASSSAMEGVLGSGSAKYFSAGVGTVMNVRVGTHVYDVKVVGIVKQAKATPGVIMGPGGMSGPAFSSLFVPVKVCEKITGQPFAPNLIYVQLKEGVDKKEFVDGLRQELAQASAVVADTDSIIQRLSSDRSVRSQKESAEMSVWLVLFSCVFIIFTTLSIGVSERTRRLALMRALGMSRMQIALLIVGEGLFLCIPALLGGLAAGFCLVYLLEEGSSSVPVLTWTTVLAAAACAVGGGLAGFHHSRMARFPPVSAGSGRALFRIHRESEPRSRVVRDRRAGVRVPPACGPASAGPGGGDAQVDLFLAGVSRPGGRCAVPGSRLRARDGVGRIMDHGAAAARAAFFPESAAQPQPQPFRGNRRIHVRGPVPLCRGADVGIFHAGSFLSGYVHARNAGFLPAYGVQACGRSGADGAAQPA